MKNLKLKKIITLKDIKFLKRTELIELLLMREDVRIKENAKHFTYKSYNYQYILDINKKQIKINELKEEISKLSEINYELRKKANKSIIEKILRV